MSSDFSNKKKNYTDDYKFENEKLQKLNDKADSFSKLTSEFIYMFYKFLVNSISEKMFLQIMINLKMKSCRR